MPKVEKDGDELNVDLTESEIGQIQDLLKRGPSITEWGMFDVMH